MVGEGQKEEEQGKRKEGGKRNRSVGYWYFFFPTLSRGSNVCSGVN